MRPNSRYLILFALPLLLGASCQGDDAGPPSIDLTVSTAAGEFDVGESVTLTAVLTNAGAGPVIVARPSASPRPVYFRVWDPSGGLMRFYGPWQKQKPLSRSGFVSLAPGASEAGTFDLSTLYDLTGVGTYRVVANYRSSDDGSQVGLAAFTTTELLSDEISFRIVSP